ncbi:SRPBCC domain-containing protein [Carboxylicivirga sp. M1479]|uniref:SRPBCC family protein n=1 Tax=Carboxylicivirga sp. M1479 TaxID=2594476 RepID=UPI001177AD52|nr:SRPBCC domain-containing protein [Carboxylicivirga sp. M1479]TRX72458.1 SRPBCC domain-containing protein [Carboxylicivirga sp. M1479]
MKVEAIITQQIFNCSSARIWEAITKVDEMRQWFFNNIPDFKAEPGFETQFMVDAGERQFMHLWRIIEVEKLKLIKYHWSYEDYTGVGFVTFKIEEKETYTTLIVISEGMGSFEPKVPEFSRESCQGGWNYFIKEQLKSYLATS